MNRDDVYFGTIEQQDPFFLSICSDAKRAYSFFLAGTTPYGKTWVANNHVNLRVALDAYHHSEKPEINLRMVSSLMDSTRLIDAVRIPKHTDFLNDPTTAAAFLREQLMAGKAVVCELDMFELPHNEYTGKEHEPHRTLLYGMNPADDTVCLFALVSQNRHTFANFEMPLEKVSRALTAECCMDTSDLQVCTLNNLPEYRLDPELIATQLRYFLSGQDINDQLEWFFDRVPDEILNRSLRNTYTSEQFVFGLDCYTWLAKRLRKMDHYLPLLTSLQSIREHFQCALLRISELNNAGFLPESAAEELNNGYSELLATTKIIQMMNIKYKFQLAEPGRHMPDLLYRIADQLEQIAETEKHLTLQLLTCLTEASDTASDCTRSNERPCKASVPAAEKTIQAAYQDYAPSRYNLLQPVDDRVVAVNTLCGSFLSLNPDGEAATWLRKGLKNVPKNPTADRLIERGYFVRSQANEQALACEQWQSSSNQTSVLRLILLPTEGCNFRCLYCYENHQPTRMSDETVSDILTFVRQNIHNYAALRISWFGGEPLLCMDLIERLSTELIDICRRERRLYISDITTNGYLLTPEIMKKLMRLRVLSYQVTVDGSAAIHDRNRPLANGEGTYNTITENIRKIRREVKTGTFQFLIRVNFTRESLEEFDSFSAELQRLLAGDKRFHLLFRPAGDWGGQIDERIRCSLVTEKSEQVLERMLRKNSNLDLREHLDFLLPCGYLCYASCASAFVIDPQGIVRKCTCHLESDANCIGKLENGKLLLDRYAAAQWSLASVAPSETCKQCVMFPVCGMSACPANRIVLKKPEDDSGYENCPLESKLLPQLIAAMERKHDFERMDG